MARPARSAASAAAATSATSAAARARHAWMSLPWLWYGRPEAPLPHCPCPGAPGKGWRFPASPPEPGAAAACRLDSKESESWGALLSGERLDTWICSLLGSLMVGLSGVFPLLVIPLEMGTMLQSEAGAWRLKQLLSFALGGLLGNVFLHLLPEAWAYTCNISPGVEGQSLQRQQQLGLWVIAGFLTFLALEKMFLNCKEEDPSQAPSKDPTAAALNGGHCLAQPAAEPGLRAVVRTSKSVAISTCWPIPLTTSPMGWLWLPASL